MTNNGCITQKYVQVTLQVILHKENAAYFKSVKSLLLLLLLLLALLALLFGLWHCNYSQFHDN